MNMLVLAIVLFFTGVLLGVAEIFIPSAGLLLVLSISAFIVSIVCAFKVSAVLGIATVLAAPVVMLIALVKGLKVFPKTFIGRRMILSHPDEPADAHTPSVPPGPAPASTGPPAEQNGELVGREGVARTELRPSGSAQIGDRRYNVVSAGDFVGQGAKVRVIETCGNRIVVEAVEDT
jgi:membrane-bound ClpP family serine protease